MSKKALNKFTKFTATKPPLYKLKRIGPSSITKKGQSKIVEAPGPKNAVFEILAKKLASKQ